METLPLFDNPLPDHSLIPPFSGGRDSGGRDSGGRDCHGKQTGKKQTGKKQTGKKQTGKKQSGRHVPGLKSLDTDVHMRTAFALSAALAENRARQRVSQPHIPPGKASRKIGHAICEHLLASLRNQVDRESKISQ